MLSNRSSWLSGLAVAAALLLVPGIGLAQHRGGGGAHGGFHGGFHGGGVHAGGHFGGHIGHFGGHPSGFRAGHIGHLGLAHSFDRGGRGWGGWGGRGWGWGGRGWGGRGWGWGYPWYLGYAYPGYSYGSYYPDYTYPDYSYGDYYYPASGYDYAPSYNYYDYGYNGGPAVPSTSEYDSAVTAPAQPDTRATVEVRVPDPNTQVWFNGVLTRQTGTDRTFQSPPLNPGQTYHYDVRAQRTQNGQPVEDSRTVNVQAGSPALVDFTAPPSPTTNPGSRATSGR